MSWSSSQYDENPFSDGNVNNQQTNSNPLIKSTPLENPPWLQDNNIQQSNNNYSPPTTFTNSSSNNSQLNSPAVAGEVDSAVPKMILYTRVANLALSICMIVVSLLSLLTTQSATTGVLACYVVVFACLLCCFETHLKQVSKVIALNFGFMYSAKSRSVFMMFVGTILFSFSLFGKIVGLLMVVNAFFNAFIVFRYPEYETLQREDAQSEIKDYLAAHPAFAKQFTDAAVSAGTSFAVNNPDVARQGLTAIFFGNSGTQSNGSGSANSSSNNMASSSGSNRGDYSRV